MDDRAAVLGDADHHVGACEGPRVKIAEHEKAKPHIAERVLPTMIRRERQEIAECHHCAAAGRGLRREATGRYEIHIGSEPTEQSR